MMKSKRKRKWNMKLNLKNRVFDLFRPIVVNFIVQQSPKECAARLRNPDKQGAWRLTNTCIAVMPMDDASYTFHIKLENNDGIGGLRPSFIKADGYLWQWGENTTYVESEVGLYYDPISVGRIIGLLIVTALQIILCFPVVKLTLDILIVICLFFVILLVFNSLIFFFIRLISRFYFVRVVKTTLRSKMR